MALTERVTFLLDVNSRGVVKEFDKVGRAADRSLGKAEERMDRLGARFTKVGAGMAGAAGLAAAALASTVDAASDLDEAINVTSLTFGDSADQLEEWAETTATAIGQSKRAALEGASAIGGLLQNVGFLQSDAADLSRRLVTLASDMGSAFNTDPADALEAIRSGLSGSSEPLRRYNVFLSEAAVKNKALELGIYDGAGAISEYEKAQARLAIILEQTERIQGDFAATSDGAANAQRVFNAQLEDFQASVGQAVLPIFTQLLDLANGLLASFNSLPKPVQEIISKAAVLATALTGLSGGALLVAGQVIKMRDSFKALNAVKLFGVTGAFGKLALAVGTAYAAWQILEDSTQRDEDFFEAVEQGAQGLSASFDEASGAMSDFTKEQLANRFASTGIAEAMAEAGLSVEDFDAAVRNGEVGIFNFRQALTETGSYTGDHSYQLSDMIVTYQRAIEIWEGAASVMGDVQGDAEGLQGAFESAGGATEFFEGQTRELESSFDDLRDAADRAKTKIDEAFGIRQTELQLTIDRREAELALINAIKENGTTLDENTDKGLENLKTGKDLIGVLEDVIEARLEETGSLQDAVAAGDEFVRGLIEQAIQAGISEEAVRGFVEELGLIPGEYVAEVTTTEAEALEEIQRIGSSLAELTSITWVTKVRPQIDGNLNLTPGNGPNEIPSGSGGGGSGQLPGDFFEGQFGTTTLQTSSASLPAVNVTVAIDSVDVAYAAAEGSQAVGGLPFKLEGDR